ncbi:MAG: hypothetical protein ABGX76_15495 [Cobetia sp.]|jgi:formylmethanofuran dehydrogenase subunit B|uniref:hypothetical protein n=1 Tax=Cobetia sp. TaxID=1873876 RepID=UPI000C5A85E1|nr:hypothetical protein [Cobetia sp.]MBF09979.1 hypothetical protein [Cobetia sp.]
MTIKTSEAKQMLTSYRGWGCESLKAETYRLAVMIEKRERVGGVIDLRMSMQHHLAVVALLECGKGQGETAQADARRTLSIDHHMSEAGRFERLSLGVAAKGDEVSA